MIIFYYFWLLGSFPTLFWSSALLNVFHTLQIVCGSYSNHMCQGKTDLKKKKENRVEPFKKN